MTEQKKQGGSGNLWLSTTRTDNTSNAYNLNASNGNVNNNAKSNTYDVRCVR